MKKQPNDPAGCKGRKNRQPSGEDAGVNSRAVAYVNITPVTQDSSTAITPTADASGQDATAGAASAQGDNKGKAGRGDVTESMIKKVYLEARSRNGDQPPATTELRMLLGNHGSFSTISKYKKKPDEEYEQSHPEKECEILRDKAITDLQSLLAERVADFKLAADEQAMDELKQQIAGLSKLLVQTEDRYNVQCDQFLEQINTLGDELEQALKKNDELQKLLDAALSEKEVLGNELKRCQDRLSGCRNIQLLLDLLKAKPDEVISLIKSRCPDGSADKAETEDKKDGGKV